MMNKCHDKHQECQPLCLVVILLTEGFASKTILEIAVKGFNLPTLFVQHVNLLRGLVGDPCLKNNYSHVVLQLFKRFLRIGVVPVSKMPEVICSAVASSTHSHVCIESNDRD